MATTTQAAKPKKPAAARKPRTTAKRTTAKAAATASTARSSAKRATTSSTRPASGVARAQQIAGRAVLIPLGVALEARDLVETYRSRSAIERQLTRFERRGGRARTQLEREVRQARERLRKRGEHAGRSLGANVEALGDRVENVVQNGVNAGKKLVNGAQERLPKVA